MSMTVKSILENTRCADISFFSSGKIDITSRVVKALSMQSGDVIDIMCAGKEFYLYVSQHSSEILGRHTARCYPTKHGSNHFRGYSRKLCEAILKECGAQNRANLAAGSMMEINGYTAIALITRNNMNSHD